MYCISRAKVNGNSYLGYAVNIQISNVEEGTDVILVETDLIKIEIQFRCIYLLHRDLVVL